MPKLMLNPDVKENSGISERMIEGTIFRSDGYTTVTDLFDAKAFSHLLLDREDLKNSKFPEGDPGGNNPESDLEGNNPEDSDPNLKEKNQKKTASKKK